MTATNSSHGMLKSSEALFRHSGQKRILIAEVIVRCCSRNAQIGRQPTKGERRFSFFTQYFCGLIQQGLL